MISVNQLDGMSRMMILSKMRAFASMFSRRPMPTVKLLASLSALATAVCALHAPAQAGVVEIKNHVLHIDGEPQPQLFGAEVQYFRLRGGLERNIPREKVLALWNKTLDQLVATHANAISFYLPWDFHEYAPGKFDFDGTADEDGDGRPDFPSRDVKTWIKLVQAHGIRHILARPGPYINAEWGFLGFGAVPLWFHERHPESHMHNARGQRTTLYSYNDPEFLNASKNWLTVVYKEVLAPYIGKGKPIHFLQLDNETNFMWQSIYAHDYGSRSVNDYREFLQANYGSIARLNSAHERSWRSFADVLPPTKAGENVAEDQDWYRFQDHTIHIYLERIRRHWESLGVTEPTVLFTLAESFNANDNGLLPHYKYRNDRGRTGMMTVNLYPKTADGADNPLFNQPFKSDHDVKGAESASDYYLGSRQEWVMGPEIQGGWWRGTHVSLESRRQTYLSTIGHGLKAAFIYYFNEGQNWQTDWVGEQAKPYFEALRNDPRFKQIPEAELPNEFWSELNETFADKVIAGFDLRWAMKGTQPKELYFDAAVGGDGEQRAPFQVLKDIGEKIIAPHGRFLAGATELTDSVCFVKDTESNVPSKIRGLSSTTMNADWAAGLIGYLLQAGINPKIVHWGLNDEKELADCRLIVHQDNGFAPASFIALVKKHVARGGGFLNFIGSKAFKAVISGESLSRNCQTFAVVGSAKGGTRCRLGQGYVYEVQKPIYAELNSADYAKIGDMRERRAVIERVLSDLTITPILKIAGGGDRVVAFGRAGTGIDQNKIYVTVKSGRLEPISARVIWTGAQATKTYRISRLLADSTLILSGKELSERGFDADMGPNGSDAFLIQPESASVP